MTLILESMSTSEGLSWQDANLRFIRAAISVVGKRIEKYRAVQDEIEWDDDQLEVEILNLRVAKDAMPSVPTLEHLYHRFDLDPFEMDLLLLCAGIELYSHFPLLCADAQGDPALPYPTFSLALSALPNANWSAISSGGTLRYWRMIDVQPGPTLLTSPLKIDETILYYLMGLSYVDQRLVGMIEPLTVEEPLAPSHQQLAQQLATTWEAQQQTQSSLLQLCGHGIEDKRAIAAAAAELLGLRLAMLSVQALPTQPADWNALLRLWDREALLFNQGLLIECDRLDPSNTDPIEALYYLLEQSESLIIVSSRERGLQLQRSLLTFDVDKPTQVEQRALWELLLSNVNPTLEGWVNRLVFQFNMDYATIHATWLGSLGQLSQTEIEPPADLASIVWESCRIQARQKLDDLVQRIEPKASWDHLILPDLQKQTLTEIAVEIQQRATVYHHWGFDQQGNRGMGISALFSGSSGTGKTLAAEVLAQTLQLDLYRIDLSAVINKYIGETEKNLRRVFDAAEAGGAILLFDEADALFGKRTEMKDSHDRYANIEVSYLLQQMEAYRGLAILTTNIPEALDQAFKRRLRFIVTFPFPDPAQRAKIWQRMFPPQMPQSGLDMEKLAQLNVAGGNIRNIVLKAAFLAAADEHPVTMSHLLQATHSEYRKLEKTLTIDEIRGWV